MNILVIRVETVDAQRHQQSFQLLELHILPFGKEIGQDDVSDMINSIAN